MSVFLPVFVQMGFATGQNGNAINGKWKSEDGDKKVQMEIYLAKDGKHYGKVINDTEKPANNGRIAMKALAYNEKEKNYTGIMQPPDVNMELNITVTLETKDRLKVVARKLLMKKTMYFIRTD
ncbi:MAG: hypothetical protein K2X48_16030 [Chitinophagaceae bacterium]|nr:hypothetical protein [Chitinophagaceae bacterium]